MLSSATLVTADAVDLSGKILDDFSGDLSSQDLFQAYPLVSRNVLIGSKFNASLDLRLYVIKISSSQ